MMGLQNRLMLSLLAALALVYFAVPYLPEMEQGLSGWFSTVWLIFVVLVIGGNLSELMFQRYPQTSGALEREKHKQNRRKKLRQH
jgi:hypothetical protein